MEAKVCYGSSLAPLQGNVTICLVLCPFFCLAICRSPYHTSRSLHLPLHPLVSSYVLTCSCPFPPLQSDNLCLHPLSSARLPCLPSLRALPGTPQPRRVDSHVDHHGYPILAPIKPHQTSTRKHATYSNCRTFSFHSSEFLQREREKLFVSRSFVTLSTAIRSIHLLLYLSSSLPLLILSSFSTHS